MRIFIAKNPIAKSDTYIFSADFMYVAGNAWICAVVVTDSRERAIKMLQEAYPDYQHFDSTSNDGFADWEFVDLGQADDQTERIEIMAWGDY